MALCPTPEDATLEPTTRLTFDRAAVKPQWDHPFLGLRRLDGSAALTRDELESLGYHYYLRFLPLFRKQPEGSLPDGVFVEFTTRMKHVLGQANLFENRVRLNERYFAREPALLPYTLFHELIHLWLYNCFLDPGHTERFYRKMDTFRATGLPMDHGVYIHQRPHPDGKYVSLCPNCNNRWHAQRPQKRVMFCGYCFDREGVRYYPRPVKGSLKGIIGIEVRRGTSPAATDPLG